MKHEEIQDLLEDYVDDRLDRASRKLVGDHLKECNECRQILDEVAPVDVSALGASVFDERRMRRTVRRSLFRTAWNTVLLAVAGWLAIWFLTALLFQPLVVNRDGRAADAVRASIDLAVMSNPGVVLTEGTITSGLFGRKVDLEFGLPVGAGLRPAISTSTALGPLTIRQNDTSSDSSDYGRFQGEPLDQLANLGDSTVATVSIWFDTPVAVETAQSIADDATLDLRVVWAGFDARLGRIEPPIWTAGGVLGYGTCQPPDSDLGDDLLGATSASFSQGAGFLFGDASVEAALDSVIAGLTDVSARDELVDLLVQPFGDDPADIEAIIRELQTDPQVAMLVVTGPSAAIAEYLEDKSGVWANVLAVDFYNWTDGICGR